MSLRESLDELLEVQDRLEIVELENKALRIQNSKQSEMLLHLQDELSFHKRFRQLVERAATIVGNIPKVKQDISSLKSM